MRKVLCHTSSIACHSNGWTNSFIPLLFCKLSSNHSVRQDRHKGCVEGIQRGGFVTLSVINLSRKFFTDKGDVVKYIEQDVNKVGA